MTVLNAVPAAVRLCAFLLYAGAGYIIVRGDISDQKIRNRHLRTCALLAVLCYGVLLVQTVLSIRFGGSSYLLWGFYQAALLDVAVSASAALALWQLRIWPAGDAKLFLLLSLLFPLTAPDRFDPMRSALIALINIFIPAALIMVLRAAYVVWKLYLDNQAQFLARLGWSRLPRYLLEGARGGAASGLWEAVRPRFDDPASAAAGVASWFCSMAMSAAVMMRLQTLLGSTLLVSGITFLLLLGWQTATARWGRLWVAAAGLGLGAALIDWSSPESLHRAFSFLANISVFSLSLQWGVGLARRLMQERGLLVAPALGILSWIAPMILMQLFGFPSWGRTLLTWSALGIFFGLGHLLVNVLEEQDRPILSLDQLRPTLVLAPDFVDRLRTDSDYFEEHFSDLYADGLTADQVVALRGWCEANGVQWVPLTATVSFAGWIFLGFLITWILGTHVLYALY